MNQKKMEIKVHAIRWKGIIKFTEYIKSKVDA